MQKPCCFEIITGMDGGAERGVTFYCLTSVDYLEWIEAMRIAIGLCKNTAKQDFPTEQWLDSLPPVENQFGSPASV